jgi:hypothetical protein
MRPTRDKENVPDSGWTKQELLDSSGLSAKTFDTLRKAARVRGPSHGGHWVFSDEDLIALVHRAESGQWTERGGPAGLAWRALLVERGIHVD